VAPYFAALTLTVILFEEGMALKLGEIGQTAPRAILLAVVAFLSAVGTLAVVSMAAAAVGWLPDSWSWMHGLMLGTILGGSSSIIVMPAMAQACVAPRLASLVNLESALTDALCVVGTSAITGMFAGAADVGVHPLIALGKSFGIAIGVGGLTGLIWLFFLRLLRSNEHAYPVTLAALLILLRPHRAAGW
jgi:cell volume regulation protein A